MEFPALKLPVKERTKLISLMRRFWQHASTTSEFRKSLAIDKKNFKCEKCEGIFSKKLLELDHIEPIGGIVKGCKGDLNIYLERLIFGKLQGLCPDCHHKKTHGEPADEDLSFLN